MKILVFGVGQFYQRRKDIFQFFLQGDELIGFVDNRAYDIPCFDGLPVYHPEQLHLIHFDSIVLASASFIEMREQLLHLGIGREKILYWGQYQACKAPLGVRKLLPEKAERVETKGKKILVVAVEMDLGGGSLAAFYTVQALVKMGYAVTLAVPDGDERLLQKLRHQGVIIWILPGLLFYPTEEISTWEKFDLVLVNVFLNIRLAHIFSSIAPTLWWIHESGDRYSKIYPSYRYMFHEHDTSSWMRDVRIAAVSQRAKEVFEAYYPGQIDTIMPIGERGPEQVKIQDIRTKPQLRFAILGGLSQIKGQDIFLEAICQLPETMRQGAEFLLIGNHSTVNAFSTKIHEKAKALPEVKMLGVLSREQLKEEFADIDVVVCASREETLSMAIVEGMMYGKICITTDATGIASYIEDGINGFVVRAGDAGDLARRMEYVLQRRTDFRPMCLAARKTYEQNFSMPVFAERLEREISLTRDMWQKGGWNTQYSSKE